LNALKNSLLYFEVAIAIRILVGLVFLTASLGKMRHWSIFQAVLPNYWLMPDVLVAPMAEPMTATESQIFS
jgi:hypothetical protein